MKHIFFLISLFLISSFVSSYTIIGNTVIREDTISKLAVTPATADCPIGTTCSWELGLKNKTAFTQTDVHIAFKVDNPIKRGKFEVWQEPVYDWVTRSITCDFDFNFTLNKFPGEQNPHEANCFTLYDNNTLGNSSDDFNRILWTKKFHTGDIPSQTAQYDVNEIVSGNIWLDRTSNISNISYLGDEYYYLSIPLTFAPFEEKKARITFEPNPNDDTKYHLYWYQGILATCLFTNSCDYIGELDPWWNTNWLFKHEFTVESPGTATDYDIFLDLNSTTIGQHFLDNVNNDFSDVRILNADENVSLDYWLVPGSVTTDTNGHIWFDGNLVAGDNNFFVYYGNSSASSLSDFNSIFDLFDEFTDGDYTSSPAWTVQRGVWTVTNTRLTENDTTVNTIDSTAPSDKELHQDFALSGFNVNFTTTSEFSYWITTSSISCDDATTDRVMINDSGTVAVMEQGSEAGVLSTVDLKTSSDTNVVIYKDKADRFYAVIGGTFYSGGNAPATGIVTGNYEKACFNANSGASADSSLDEIWYSQSTLDDVNVTYSGTTESVNSVEIITIDSVVDTALSWFSAHGNIDGNFTVTFDLNSNATFLLDGNYSTSTTQGTGTSFFDDANITDSRFTCDSADFTTLNNQCSFDMNFSSVSDGNNFISLDMNANNIFVFNVTDTNFGLDNTLPVFVDETITSGTLDSSPDFNLSWTETNLRGCWYNIILNSSTLSSNNFQDGSDSNCNIVNPHVLSEDDTLSLEVSATDQADNNSTQQTTATYTFNAVGNGGNGGGSGGGDSGAGGTLSVFDFNVTQETNNILSYTVQKALISNFSVTVENSGTEDIESISIEIKDLDGLVEPLTQESSFLLKSGEKTKFDFSFDARSLPADAFLVTGTVIIKAGMETGGRTKSFDIVFAIEETVLTPLFEVLSISIAGLTLNTVLLLTIITLVLFVPQINQDQLGLGVAGIVILGLFFTLVLGVPILA